jgi:hypothetical protein
LEHKVPELKGCCYFDGKTGIAGHAKPVGSADDSRLEIIQHHQWKIRSLPHISSKAQDRNEKRKGFASPGGSVKPGTL